MRLVCAVVTAVACWLVEAWAWFSDVWALLTCWESLSFVFANEFCAWVNDDCVCVEGAAS